MNIPSKNDCFQLMCQMQMLENIVAHSIQVCRVGMCLVDHLKLQDGQMNGQLVQAAALLHDITKTRSFETEENHALTGGQVLNDFGYPEVGNLVRQHVYLDDYSEHQSLPEAVIINYADKRVLHDRIVSLDERMSYIQERYGTRPEHKRRIQLLWEKTAALEKHIFKYLPFSPDDLNHHLASLDISSEISDYRKACSQLTSESC
ncbi:MAG: HD domain-containing protein [Desulfobacterales bacterium]|jgi:putative nucleotidyltransferase with HDIG domain|nr:HD domain-containing protein [Desulfobacterales bacterium]MDH3828617.1 HD domain-containing protein [Desulfobacterales bacterium]